MSFCFQIGLGSFNWDCRPAHHRTAMNGTSWNEKVSLPWCKPHCHPLNTIAQESPTTHYQSGRFVCEVTSKLSHGLVPTCYALCHITSKNKSFSRDKQSLCDPDGFQIAMKRQVWLHQSSLLACKSKKVSERAWPVWKVIVPLPCLSLSCRTKRDQERTVRLAESQN